MLYCFSSTYKHVSTLHQSRHWLPIHYRIQFKLITLTHKALHSTAHPYPSSLISVYYSSQALCSANDLKLNCSIIQTSHSRLQDFSCDAPVLWNVLPRTIRLLHNIHSFKRALKIHLLDLPPFLITPSLSQQHSLHSMHIHTVCTYRQLGDRVLIFKY